MTEKKKSLRLSSLMRDFGVGRATLVDILEKNGFHVEDSLNAKIDEAAYELIVKELGIPNKKKGAEGDKGAAAPRTSKTATAKTVKKSSATAQTAEQPSAESVIETKIPKIAVTVTGKVDLDNAATAEGQTNLPEVEGKQQELSVKKKVEESVAEAQKPEKLETKATVKKSLHISETQDAQALEEKEALPSKVEKEEKKEKAPDVPTAKVSQQEGKLSDGQGGEKIETSEQKKGEVATTKQEAEVLPAEVATSKEQEPELIETKIPHVQQPKVVGTIDLKQTSHNGKRKQYEAKVEMPPATPVAVTTEEEKKETPAVAETTTPANPSTETTEVFRTNVTKLAGTTVVGKIDLASLEEKTRRKPEASATPGGAMQKRRRRKKIGSGDEPYASSSTPSQQGGGGHTSQQNTKNNQPQQRDNDRRNKKKVAKKPEPQQEITRDVIEERYKETRARITARENARSKVAKLRKEKRSLLEVRREEENLRNEEARKTLQVSEFVSVNELAGMMEVPVTEVIDACMSLDLMVSINQRLDGEALVLVADEFGFKVEFVGPTLEEELSAEEDDPADLVPRVPIFTVFGHVDHGKTSLCNYITKRAKQEEGGITQSITADIVTLPGGERMVLVDTPGHEAFTAMRSRGAKIADVAIIVISAVEGVQPQTVEVMNHAASNGVHMVFAINKIDMPEANPRRVMDELANMNYLVEEYGGKYQCQEISARQGTNVDKLLEKVLLEASLMELKANPKRHADAVVLEVTQKLGLGACVNVIVRNGTLHKGDRIVAGQYYGRVRSLHLPTDSDNSRGILEAEPSIPVMVIGLNGKPQAGDHLLVVDTDKQARDMATKIGRIRRLQKMNSEKPITLDELGRRIALGDFKELKLIIKADVDGSVEALADALLKLSTPEINVNVIYKGVGQITETDVSLAKSSDAVIVGFQVRPNMEAKRAASDNGIDIHLYSVIYDAIEEVQQAMEGMLAPEVKEEILGTAEVKEIFHISKVGTIAGCMVREGKILRGSKVRVIRDGIVVYSSELLTLKHYKDEAKEVTLGQECGMSVKNYNDIKVGDLIEAYRETEVKRSLV